MTQSSNTGDKASGRLARQLTQMTILAFVIILLVAGLYFFHFDGELSQSPNKWGLFGDYMGGVLNPIIGFLALIALLMTIVLQSKELAATREEMKMSREELANSAQALQDSRDIAAQQAEHNATQAKKEDIYRMINHVFADLNRTFYSEVKHPFIRTGLNVGVLNVPYSHLFGQDKTAHYQSLSEGNAENIKLTDPVAARLIELQYYLQEYEQISGNNEVTRFYKSRYTLICNDLHEKQHIPVAVFDYYVG